MRPQPGPPLQRTVISSVCDHGVWCVITQKPYCEWGLETPGHLWLMDREGSLFPNLPSPSYIVTALQANAGEGGWAAPAGGKVWQGCERLMLAPPYLWFTAGHLFALCCVLWALQQPFWSPQTCTLVCETTLARSQSHPRFLIRGAEQHPSSSESFLPLTDRRKGITFPLGGLALGNKPPLASCWGEDEDSLWGRLKKWENLPQIREVT